MGIREEEVRSLDRHKKALELRIAGVSYQKIADNLGYKSRGAAGEAVKSALKKTLQEPADELRTLECERLNSIFLVIWPLVKQGNMAAIDRAIRIQERRAKYLGLDAPEKRDLTSDGKPLQIPTVIEVLRDKE